MTEFMNRDFLLTTQTAKKIYHEYAAKMPIIDYHCHVSAREIWEDKKFSSITELWLSGDHYKWRLMRSAGIDEYYVTGAASDFERFERFASVLPRAIGNPMYHWCHLELKTYFGYEGLLNAETAAYVYELCRQRLKDDDMSVRSIIERSCVEFIGTTDDPVDSLEYHKLIAREGRLGATVAPSFRPDKALNIEKAGWVEYIRNLSNVSGVCIRDFDSLKQALRVRMEYFANAGCRASDHGLDYISYAQASNAELNDIVSRVLDGERATAEDAAKLKTALLVFCAEEYVKLDWVMQIHFNCLRNPNTAMLDALGVDTGFDCIGPHDSTASLSALLDRMWRTKAMPRLILYSLDPTDNAFIDSLIGAFQGGGVPCRIQHGSAWWFNDHKIGMRNHMESLASMSLLGDFIGMLTDSRSFLSYTRHEYFRRILCQLIGEWVEGGEYPSDERALCDIVQNICYYNAKRFFKL